MSPSFEGTLKGVRKNAFNKCIYGTLKESKTTVKICRENAPNLYNTLDAFLKGTGEILISGLKITGRTEPYKWRGTRLKIIEDKDVIQKIIQASRSNWKPIVVIILLVATLLGIKKWRKRKVDRGLAQLKEITIDEISSLPYEKSISEVAIIVYDKNVEVDSSTDEIKITA